MCVAGASQSNEVTAPSTMEIVFKVIVTMTKWQSGGGLAGSGCICTGQLPVEMNPETIKETIEHTMESEIAILLRTAGLVNFWTCDQLSQHKSILAMV